MTFRDGNIVITVLGLLILVAATGCCMILPAGPVQPAYITSEPPYTARLMFPYKEGERVKNVKIYEYEDIDRFPGTKRTICWHIKATKPVPARGFRVTIGNTPDGFRQVVPKQGMSFEPVSNRSYRVVFTTTNRNVHYGTWWDPGDDRMLYHMLRP